MTDAISQFQRALEEFGIPCSDPIQIDGDLHRYRAPGDKDENGWYCIYGDNPIQGEFGHWRIHGDRKIPFKYNEQRDLSPDEIKERERNLARRRQEKKRKKEKEKENCRVKAVEVWSVSTPNPTENAYLLRKRIQSHVARVYQGETQWFTNEDRKPFPIFPGDLVIPLTKEGKLVSIQLVRADENARPQKPFLTGTDKDGGYCHLGPPPLADDATIVICEGYATGASIFEATGLPVFVAFDRTNLKHVAIVLRKRNPNARIILAADDDIGTPGNPGVTDASNAAALVSGELLRPVFPQPRASDWTDFNDLAVKALSLDEVRHQFETGKPSFEIHVEAEMIPVVPDSMILDELPDMVQTRQGRKAQCTIRNLAAILERVGGRVRYNTIKKDQEWFINGEQATVNNQKKVIYARILDTCERFRYPTKNVDDYLTYLCDKNQYNPVVNWIESKPWDKVSRIGDLCATITAQRESEVLAEIDQVKYTYASLKNTLITRWLVSAVASAYRPNGTSAHGVLVFQGDQYSGKTQWFKRLVPEELRRELLADGKNLRPDDKDSVKQVVCYWLVELGEIDSTFRKSDIASLKAFITRDFDMFRAAYEKHESNHPRSTVFFGSVNQREFLADATGNRRFWTIECAKIKHDHDIDMQQLWAEVAELYKAGESWFLTKDEATLLNEHNRDFEIGDPVEERIENTYNWSETDILKGHWLNATGVLIECGYHEPKRTEKVVAAAVLRRLNKGQYRRKLRQFWVPPLRKHT